MQNNEKLPNRAKTRKMRYPISIACIIGIFAIIIAGFLWQGTIDSNSTYQERDIKVAFITSNSGYNDILREKLDMDSGVTI
ncbi:MAG: hypothetical protein ACFFCS_28845, partial [Candidatus Hodarchaeota archaeon]